MSDLASSNAEIRQSYRTLRSMRTSFEVACEQLGLQYELAPSTIASLISGTTHDGSDLGRDGQIAAARAAAWPASEKRRLTTASA